MNISNETPVNPYAAPQAELNEAPPKIIYTDKFNGRLAFWLAVLLAALMLWIYLPEVKTDRTRPRTAVDYIIAFSLTAVLSTSFGLYMGSICGTPEAVQIPELDEEPPSDEPSP